MERCRGRGRARERTCDKGSSLVKMTCMILHDLASIWQDVLARLSHARILPSFMQDFGKII